MLIETLEDRTLLSGNPVFDGNPYSFNVSEDVPVGALVGSVNATDPEGAAVEYFLEDDSVNLGGPFDIDELTGDITTTRELDFETTSFYTLTIIANDPDWNETTGYVNITIGDVDENAFFNQSSYSFNLDENAPVGTVLGTLTGSDPQSDPLTIYLNDGNENKLFAIDELTGDVTLQSPLDFETQSLYSLTAFVEDPDGNGGSALVEVTINDVSGDPVFDEPSYAFSMQEHDPTGTYIETVSATDPQGQAVSYTLEQAWGNASFAIDPLTGDITVDVPMEYREYPTLDFTVYATNTSGIVTAAPITVDVIDFDETPNGNAAPALSNVTFTITEYDDGFATGNLSATITDDHVLDNGMFALEVDVDNDGIVDWNEYLPSNSTDLSSEGDISYGNHDVAVRLTEIESESGNSIPGSWTVATLSVDPALNTAPNITNLEFTLDDGFGLDHSEARGFLSGDIVDDTRTFGTYEVQVDLNGDGIPDYVSDPGLFETDSTSFAVGVTPATSNVGSNTYGARVVEYDSNSGQTLVAPWASLTFTVDPPVNTAPLLDFVEFDGVDNGTGYLDGELYGEAYDELLADSTFDLEVDFDGDGMAEQVLMVDPGSFSDWLTAVPVGAALQIRVVEHDAYGRTLGSACVLAAAGTGTERNTAPLFSQDPYYFTVNSDDFAAGPIPNAFVTAIDQDAGDTVTYRKDEPGITIQFGNFVGGTLEVSEVVSIDPATGQISIVNPIALAYRLRDVGSYSFHVRASDGKTNNGPTTVYIVDNYQALLTKMENHITNWRDDADNAVIVTYQNADAALDNFKDFVKSEVSAFTGTTNSATNLTWALSKTTPASVASVLTQIAINSQVAKGAKGYTAVYRGMQRQMQTVRDQDLARNKQTKIKEDRALTKLKSELSQMTSDVQRMWKAAPYWNDLQTRLRDPGPAPPANDIYGEMLIELVNKKGWQMTGNSWNMYWQEEWYVTYENHNIFSLDAINVADKLNEIKYYKGEGAGGWVSDAGPGVIPAQ